MRKIAHLSDLHFGRVDEAVLPALVAAMKEIRPDYVVVSGDLTQRARRREFQAARDFLAGLEFPKLVVPGNHDVPLYNAYLRAFHPLARFRRFLGADVAPLLVDEEVAIVGVNTARSLTFKDGRINREQVAAICHRLLPLGERVTRIVVSHHPFHGKDAEPGADLVGRARMAMAEFARCRVDLILSGHLHTAQSALGGQHYAIRNYSALLVQAGTATSIRRRGESNSFNLIRVDWPQITVERWSWDVRSAAFSLFASEQFTKVGDSWKTSSTDTP